MLTLTDVAANPHQIAQAVPLPDGRSLLYRPLIAADVDDLTTFLESLSAATRNKWLRDGYDRTGAEEICEAIGRYDKLRLVAVDPERPEEGLLALFEFSFGIPAGDHSRFAAYGLSLNEAQDCRFGPCVRDDYQSRGLGSALMPATFDIATRFDKKNIFLWGGVHVDNDAALAFYCKHGFREVGRFYNDIGKACLDMIRALPGSRP